MRLIDADLLKSATVDKNSIWDKITDASGRGLSKIIDGIPTADVQPVVRGEWVEDGAVMKCSVCGNSSDYCGTENFCNYCGSDMRGGTE